MVSTVRGEGVAEAVNEVGPEVAALLLEAADQIAASFGPEPTLVLEYFLGPEDEDDPGEQFAFIQTPLKSVQARPLMERFWYGWWHPASLHVIGNLNIGLEIV